MANYSLTWPLMKIFIDSRGICAQWIELEDSYRLWAYDGPMAVQCALQKDGGADVTEFEATYKAAGNQAPKADVTTQFEKNDKDLKICSAKADFDATTGECTIDIQVPGGDPSQIGRYIESGLAWCEPPEAGDRITWVAGIDGPDGLMSGTPYATLKTYHDEDMPDDLQGWYIPKTSRGILMETLAGYGSLPGTMILRVKAKRVSPSTLGTFYMNIKWGKKG